MDHIDPCDLYRDDIILLCEKRLGIELGDNCTICIECIDDFNAPIFDATIVFNDEPAEANTVVIRVEPVNATILGMSLDGETLLVHDESRDEMINRHMRKHIYTSDELQYLNRKDYRL